MAPEDLPIYPAAIPKTRRKIWRYLLSAQKAFMAKRLQKTVNERINGRNFIIPSGVFNPAIFRSGVYFASFIEGHKFFIATLDRLEKSPRILDLGTGCGVLAIFMAGRGYDVIATDISEEAIITTRANAHKNGLAGRVTAVSGDLFEPVEGKIFDIILCSLPKKIGSDKQGLGAYFWADNNVLTRFTEDLPRFLSPEGSAFVILTTDGDDQVMIDGLLASGLGVKAVSRLDKGMEIMTIYEVRHPQVSGL